MAFNDIPKKPGKCATKKKIRLGSTKPRWTVTDRTIDICISSGAVQLAYLLTPCRNTHDHKKKRERLDTFHHVRVLVHLNHRQHRAGRTHLVDLDTQRASDVGENRIQQSGTSTPRISNFRDDLTRITESPRGSSFAQTRAERGRFLPTLQPCSPAIGG